MGDALDTAMDEVLGWTVPGHVVEPWPQQELRDIVATAAGLGHDHKVIAKLVRRNGRPVSLDVLREHFSHELDDARDRLTLNVEMAFLELARTTEDPRVKAQILAKFLTHKGGWTPTPTRVEHTGANGEAIRVEVEHRANAAMEKAARAMAAIEGGIRLGGEVADAEKKQEARR